MQLFEYRLNFDPARKLLHLLKDLTWVVSLHKPLSNDFRNC